MKLVPTAILACVFLLSVMASAEEQSRVVRWPKEFSLPDLELKGRLGDDVDFADCERISGITCTIELKKGHSLPSRIFVEELDSDGKSRNKAWPLIYPRLSPGQKGKATFLHVHGNPQRLILRGEWSGAWRSQY